MTTLPMKLIRDVQYGVANGTPLLLDILRPDPLPTTPMPAIIEIHGGAWMEGGRDARRNLPLAASGFFTASISYRLSHEATFPAQIHDAKAAVRWLRANAASYNVDPARVGVWGVSAGAHLAALLGTSADVPELEGNGSPHVSSRVQAVLDICGPTDMLDPQWSVVQRPGSLVAQLFGGALAERAALVRLANPITHIGPSTPPFLIVHGDQDVVVPIRQSELLAQALEAAGKEVTFVRAPGVGHTFNSAWAAQIAQMGAAFFNKHL